MSPLLQNSVTFESACRDLVSNFVESWRVVMRLWFWWTQLVTGFSVTYGVASRLSANCLPILWICWMLLQVAARTVKCVEGRHSYCCLCLSAVSRGERADEGMYLRLSDVWIYDGTMLRLIYSHISQTDRSLHTISLWLSASQPREVHNSEKVLLATDCWQPEAIICQNCLERDCVVSNCREIWLQDASMKTSQVEIVSVSFEYWLS